jgi:hypothetical protein
MERRVRFDRSKFLQNGLLTAAFGIVAFVAAVYAEEFLAETLVPREVSDLLSPILILVSPVLVIAGIVMIVVGLAAEDEPRPPVDDAALQARTREIMESEGLGWTAAWHRAKNETPRPPSEPAQDSPDLEHRLRELKRLHDDGLIDTEEYQRKQRTLLDGL